jgi:hypothetical protein
VRPSRHGPEPTQGKALARALRHQWLLDEGRRASISGMAAAERVERGYLGSLLRQMLLAQDVEGHARRAAFGEIRVAAAAPAEGPAVAVLPHQYRPAHRPGGEEGVGALRERAVVRCPRSA